MSRLWIGGSVAILVAIVTAMVLSMTVAAATVDIAPQGEFTKTVSFHTGEVVRWSWTAQQFDLSFNIKDPDGDVAYTADSKVTDTGTLTATSAGNWTFNWQNGMSIDPSYDHTITLDYAITILNTPPTAHITANVTSGIVPLSVALNGSGTDPDGSIVSYSWDLGDGGSASTQNVAHTYTAVGSYTVNLTCTDDDGAKGYAEVVITVLPVNPTVTSTTPAQGATGVALDIHVIVEFSLPMVRADVLSKMSISPAAGFTLSWSNGDKRVLVTFGQALAEGTSYTLTVGRANATNGGRLAHSFTLSFTTLGVANVPPTASISTDVSSGIAPLAVNFTGTGTDTDGTITSYLWQFGDGEIASTKDAAHTYSTPGTYTANLTVTDNDGAHGSAEALITVLPVKPVVATFYPANNAVGVAVTVDVAVNFSLPMSRSDLQAKTTIVPTAAMTFTWSDSDKKVSISFTQDLLYLTHYTLTIARANATNGGQMASPFVLSFTTRAQEVVKTVRILTPISGTSVHQGTKITLTGDSTGIAKGQQLNVTFGGVTKKATIGADGKWSVEFTAPDKTGDYTVTASLLDATYSIKLKVTEEAAKGASPMIWIVLLLAIIIAAILVFLLLGRRGPKTETVVVVPIAEVEEMEVVEPPAEGEAYEAAPPTAKAPAPPTVSKADRPSPKQPPR